MKDKARIFVLDDDELIVSMLSRALSNEGHTVKIETRTGRILEKINAWTPDILLLDIRLPETDGIQILKELMATDQPPQVVMLTADDTAETAVRAMKLGAVDYLTKPFNMEEVKLVIQKILEKEKLKEEVGYFRKLCDETFDHEIVGESRSLRRLISDVEQAARTGVSTILITGESGTGKELLARHIYRVRCGEDSFSPFIRVNCAALPETLLEAELFGYVKGAFTDAGTDKKGLFELADGGCLLLDEISEMKGDLQSKLLRVLENQRIRRVGGKEEISVEVTVIATTNRDLPEAVDKGRFRLDLFYRLSAFQFHIPPLRKRREDIPLLARHFLSFFSTKYNRKTVKGFSRPAMARLTAYDWPGNVRELRNVVERLVVLKDTGRIEEQNLPKEIVKSQSPGGETASGRFLLPESGISLEDLEKDFIVQALRRTGNNKVRAAKLLNMSYDSLRYQIKKFGLE